jgi:hypothetical protein
MRRPSIFIQHMAIQRINSKGRNMSLMGSMAHLFVRCPVHMAFTWFRIRILPERHFNMDWPSIFPDRAQQSGGSAEQEAPISPQCPRGMSVGSIGMSRHLSDLPSAAITVLWPHGHLWGVDLGKQGVGREEARIRFHGLLIGPIG